MKERIRQAVQAERAYRDQQAKAADQIAKIQTLLQAHTGKQKGSPASWAWAGDLEAVNALLERAAGFLEG